MIYCLYERLRFSWRFANEVKAMVSRYIYCTEFKSSVLFYNDDIDTMKKIVCCGSSETNRRSCYIFQTEAMMDIGIGLTRMVDCILILCSVRFGCIIHVYYWNEWMNEWKREKEWQKKRKREEACIQNARGEKEKKNYGWDNVLVF